MSHEDVRTALAAWRDAERDRRARPYGSAERTEAERAVQRARLAFDAAVAREHEPTEGPAQDATLLETGVTGAPA